MSEEKAKLLGAELLRSEGYLQEVNRVFFHPLGLALAVSGGVIGVLDFRDDLEGMIFDPGDDLREKADLVEAQRNLRRIPRLERLGYFVQPVEPLRTESPADPDQSSHSMVINGPGSDSRVRLVLDEGDRQLILLAIAELALSRPGFDDTLRRIAKLLFGVEMFGGFKRCNADRVKASHGSVGSH